VWPLVLYCSNSWHLLNIWLILIFILGRASQLYNNFCNILAGEERPQILTNAELMIQNTDKTSI
jgi:hypothetical protein